MIKKNILFFSNLTIFLLIYFLSNNAFSQKVENNTSNEIVNKHWALKEYNKHTKFDNYKILLDFGDITHYNLRRKILKNIIYNTYSHKQVKSSEIKLEEAFEEFQKNKKEIKLTNSKEFLRAADNLKKLLKFILSKVSDKTGGLNKKSLLWPSDGRLISNYGKQQHKSLNAYVFENGIKIKNNFGAEVKAAETGIVRYSDSLFGFGKVLIIDHGKTFFTVYGYMSEISVENNSKVDKGQIIGKVGDSESYIGSCLYFEVREGAESYNPIDWLGSKKE